MVKPDIYQKYTFYRNKGLSGLSNLGNTCYINSVLQCISNIIPLTHYLLTSLKINEELNPLVQTYIKLLIEIWKENRPLAPVSFKNCINEIIPKFKGNNQHDAHEFLNDFMYIFHNNLPLKKIYFKINENSNKYIKKADDSWKRLIKQPSVISDLFYGQFCNIFRCNACEYITKVYDPFLTFDIEITKNECFLSDNINKYFLRDIVYMKCENCAPEEKDIDVEHEVDKGIFKLPENLIISLKRFKNNKKNNNLVLLDTVLDFSEYSYVSTDESVIYDLQSIVCHKGDLNQGHYFSLIKKDNNWYCFDDMKVNTFNYKNLDMSLPYILFYTKR